MSLRTDIAIDINKNYKEIKKYKNGIEILENKYNKNIFRTIKFNNIENNKQLLKIISKELLYFIKLNKKNIKHILLIGLGNEENTADSIGPKTIKNIKINFKIDNINNINSIKISALIPGVLGITGINTDKIIFSVTKSINPDLVILIDSFVTNNIDFINKTIEISNHGITPGSGLYKNNNEISKNKLKKPIITIGIPTSLEYIYNNIPLLLTPTNIDSFVKNISLLLSDSLNNIFYNDLIDTPL